MPDGKCASSVNEIINDISKKYNTPIFKPHVTLIRDCEKEKCDKLYFIFKREKIDFALLRQKFGFVITNYSGYDPEVRTRAVGVDYLMYPRPTTYLLGGSITF